MRGLGRITLFSVFLLSFLFLGCGATRFTTVWKDETYQGHPAKILVISAFPYPATRQIFEDEFVKALKDRKVEAFASHTILPEPIVSDRAALAPYAMAAGADTVLITKPTGTSTENTIGAAGISYRDLYINTQTDVYTIKPDKLIMSAAAETWIHHGEPVPDQIRSYVKILVARLSRSGLF